MGKYTTNCIFLTYFLLLLIVLLLYDLLIFKFLIYRVERMLMFLQVFECIVHVTEDIKENLQVITFTALHTRRAKYIHTQGYICISRNVGDHPIY